MSQLWEKFMQLELFEEPRDMRIDREIAELKSQINSLRKGLFARHSELAKMYSHLEHEFETLKQALCREPRA